ncbi:MAG: CvpA family protein [Clostridia bacterium]|nr:CvpA family protein [Clostridia bacterium]
MQAGLIVDIVVAILIIVNLVVCTHRGFIRCVISSLSSILAFAIAIFSTVPLAKLLENKFGWESAVAKWHIPFISSHALFCLLVGIAIFVLVRLLCLLLDKLLQMLKEKLKVIGIIDRILGTVFGLFSAFLELTSIFLLINQLGWASALSLTSDGGGYFAWRIYEFCRTYLFDILIKVTGAVSDYSPKI